MNYTVTAERPQQREGLSGNLNLTLLLFRIRLKKYEFVGACDTNRRKRHAYRNLEWKRRDNWEEIAMDVKIILKWFFRK
jgi:hypothetical protein